MHCKPIGILLQTRVPKGCEMGPTALRVSGPAEALRDLGHEVTDLGNIALPEPLELSHPNGVLRHLGEISEWIRVVYKTGHRSAVDGMPIFLSGDYASAAVTFTCVARRADDLGLP